MKVMRLIVSALSTFILGVLSNESPQNNFKFFQTDYNIKLEWAEVASYDHRIFKQFNLIAFKFNRTSPACNFTYISNVNMGNNLEMIFQFYKFSSNEYREFPLRFQMNTCTAITNNIAGLRGAFDCGNFTGCPILKNKHMHICNFMLDPSQFPPYIPNGKYNIDTRGMYQDKEVFVVYLYVEVYRPFTG